MRNLFTVYHVSMLRHADALATEALSPHVIPSGVEGSRIGSLKVAQRDPSALLGMTTMPNRIFLLSPAYAGGKRARMILSDRAQFDLARRLRSRERASLGEVFTFLSGLYFRGKLAYASAFACAENGLCGVLVITPTRGLVDARRKVGPRELREFAEVDIKENNPRYREPLAHDAEKLAKKLTTNCEVILLGSVATGKYIDVLLENFGDRLRFPAEFVGRGDMSRGGLLLRCAVDKTELSYISVAGAVRKGKRPPRLEPRRYSSAS
jgi:hypothetical protein